MTEFMPETSLCFLFCSFQDVRTPLRCNGHSFRPPLFRPSASRSELNKPTSTRRFIAVITVVKVQVRKSPNVSYPFHHNSLVNHAGYLATAFIAVATDA